MLPLRNEPGQLIKTKSGDFVFFVTIGQHRESHKFGEAITKSGKMLWESQGWMGLRSPLILQFIQHNSSENNIFLFLRTDESNPFSYLGKLTCEWHDPTREMPVHLRWKLLDWPPEPNYLDNIGLCLLSDPEEAAPWAASHWVSKDQEPIEEWEDDRDGRIAELLGEVRKTPPIPMDTKGDGLVPMVETLRARLDQVLNPLTYLEILVLALRLGLEDGREMSVRGIGETFSLTDLQVETVIDAALKKLEGGGQLSEIYHLKDISAELPKINDEDPGETGEIDWQGLGVLTTEDRLDIKEDWTEIEIISELGVSVGQFTYLPVVKVRVIDDNEEKYWVLLGSSIKESLDPLRIGNLGSLMGLVVSVRSNEQYYVEVSTTTTTEEVCRECGVIIPSGARIFYKGPDDVCGVDCHKAAQLTRTNEGKEGTLPTASLSKPNLPIRRLDIPRVRWCATCSRTTNQFVVKVSQPLQLKCRLCGSIWEP